MISGGNHCQYDFIYIIKKEQFDVIFWRKKNCVEIIAQRLCPQLVSYCSFTELQTDTSDEKLIHFRVPLKFVANDVAPLMVFSTTSA